MYKSTFTFGEGGNHTLSQANSIVVDVKNEDNVRTEVVDRPTCSVTNAPYENLLNGFDFFIPRRHVNPINVPRDESSNLLPVGPSSVPPHRQRSEREQFDTRSRNFDGSCTRQSGITSQIPHDERPNPVESTHVPLIYDDSRATNAIQQLENLSKMMENLQQENERLKLQNEKLNQNLNTLIETLHIQQDSSMLTKLGDAVNETANRNHSHRLETKDIYELKFKDMAKMNAPALIEAFCTQVKHVGGSEEDCVNIALAKMEINLRLYIENQLKDRGSRTLQEVKDILLNKFNRPRKACDAIDELCNLRFHIEDCPRQYMNEFYRRYDEILRAFPGETPKGPGRMWKNTVIEFLPKEFRRELINYVDEQGDESFIQKLEKLKVMYDARRNMGALHQSMFTGQQSVTTMQQPLPTMQQSIPTMPQPVPSIQQSMPTMHPHPVPTVQQSVPAMQQSVTSPLPSGTRQWASISRKCYWCQDGSEHLRRDCPRQPPPYSCFDCLQPNSRKGHPGCPGFNGPRPPPPGQ